MALRIRRRDIPKYEDYRRYKQFLREDFCYCCVYCTIHENENGGPRNFHVEHYKPKSMFPQLKCDYHNLLYACAICNSYKLDDWPSDDPLVDGLGYLDPCQHDYDEHFVYSIDFDIRSRSAVAQYMIERLHLNRQQLKKIRKIRHQAEVVSQKVVKLDGTLAAIEEFLQNEVLPPELVASLNQFIQEAREQYASDKQVWAERREPIVNLEDYR